MYKPTSLITMGAFILTAFYILMTLFEQGQLPINPLFLFIMFILPVLSIVTLVYIFTEKEQLRIIFGLISFISAPVCIFTAAFFLGLGGFPKSIGVAIVFWLIIVAFVGLFVAGLLALFKYKLKLSRLLGFIGSLPIWVFLIMDLIEKFA